MSIQIIPMFKGCCRIFVLLPLFFLQSLQAKADEDSEILWEVSSMANVGDGEFAPYYVSALQHGKVFASKGFYLDAAVEKPIEFDKRFSWGAGVELHGGISSKVSYLKWVETGETTLNDMRAAPVNIQQLYGIIRYRSLYVMLGMKNHESILLNNSLTIGDLVESGNAREIPQLRLGLVDFRNIPLTKGWLQVQGEIGIGKFTDNHWLEKFYSYGSNHINTDAWFTYRRLYFRTRPAERFSATFGLQAAGELGGTTRWFYQGRETDRIHESLSFNKFLKWLFPIGAEKSGKGEYYDGNNLGSWDILLRYRLPWAQTVVKLYLEKPWEKGSSLGWGNAWDGLWGVEFDFGRISRFFKGVLFEYLTTMNQSGAFHFSPDDYPGTTIPSDIHGGDEYYNNNEYNSYQNYGHGIGTPFLKSPIYNLDGFPQYVDNRLHGFQLSANGQFNEISTWKIAISHRKAYGSGRQPRLHPVDDTSWMIEVGYRFRSVRGLSLNGKIAADHGDMLGNNFGIALTAVYKGAFSLK